MIVVGVDGSSGKAVKLMLGKAGRCRCDRLLTGGKGGAIPPYRYEKFAPFMFSNAAELTGPRFDIIHVPCSRLSALLRKTWRILWDGTAPDHFRCLVALAVF